MLRSKGRRKLNTGTIKPNASLKIEEGMVPKSVKNPVKNPVVGALHNTWDAPHPGASSWTGKFGKR